MDNVRQPLQLLLVIIKSLSAYLGKSKQGSSTTSSASCRLLPERIVLKNISLIKLSYKSMILLVNIVIKYKCVITDLTSEIANMNGDSA
jgi:hypothetical protein